METLETLGKYEIRRVLGRGATGIVYEGWDQFIARRVAIKTVKLPEQSDPETVEALARFRREAQAAGQLSHPNIVAVFDYGETDDLAYIVMEFVDGPPLKSLLDRQDRFPLSDTVRIMQDLLAGLQFSHERGVVHRDIKPGNVMLTRAGQAKIADFGIARIESSSITQAGTMIGTPAYMSPEQLMGHAVDARTDIYSAGVVLYQLLTGERPFEGGLSAIAYRALHTEPPPPSELSVTAPPALDAVVRRAMEKRPEDRFPSAKAFAEAMRGVLATQATAEDEATVVIGPPAVGAVAPRSKWPTFVALSAILLAGMGAAAWWLMPRPPPPSPVIAAAAPPPAVMQPPPTQVATANPGDPPRRIDDWVNSRDCAALSDAVAGNGIVTLIGLAGEPSASGLRQALALLVTPDRIDWHVDAVDHVFCPALNVLHLTKFGGVSLRMAEGITRLHDGDHVSVRLVMPDFPSWLRVDYVAHDGSVQHLYPQLAEPQVGIVADSPHSYGPGEVVELANPAWTIGTPYGTDMIIAVASSQALFSSPRPSNAENADVYLHDLQATMDELRQHGGRLAGGAVTLEALPK